MDWYKDGYDIEEHYEKKPSNTFKDKLKQFEAILDQYDSKIGIDKIIYNNKVEEVLLMEENQLKNLDKAGLEEYSFLLAQYSALLNKEINRNKVRLFYAENQLSLIIAENYSSFSSFMKYDVMKSSVILSNTAASVLNNIILHANSRILEIENISQNVLMMAKILSSLSRSKNEF